MAKRTIFRIWRFHIPKDSGCSKTKMTKRNMHWYSWHNFQQPMILFELIPRLEGVKLLMDWIYSLFVCFVEFRVVNTSRLYYLLTMCFFSCRTQHGLELQVSCNTRAKYVKISNTEFSACATINFISHKHSNLWP